ncbi:hypothetical protein Tco_0272889 [Tanacetum coccineum]
MMTLPSEHLLTFNNHKDAKSLFEAIEARFGGNEATKKTQKTLLKQMYETFNASRAQKNLTDILNTVFLLDGEMHVVVWRNKSDLGSISFDDLYNNFKIVEPEVKRSIISSSNPGSQNLAFLSGHSSTNDVNTSNVHISTGSTHVSTASTNNSTACLSNATIYAYLATQPNGSQVLHKDLEQIHEDDLDKMDLKWQLALLSMKERKFYQRTGKKIIINGSDTAGYDKKKNRSQDSSRRTVNVEESSSKAMLAIDGTGFDWSYMADEEASTNFALMAFSDFEVQNNKTCSKTCLKNFEDLKSRYDKLRIELNKSESDLDSYKKGLASVEEQLVFYKKNESMLYDQIAVLKRDSSFNESDINALKKQVERLKKEKEDNQFKINNFENASKSLDQLIGNQISDNNKKGLGYNDVPLSLIGLFAPPSIDLLNSGLEKLKQPEFEGYGVKANKGASKNVSKEVKKTSDAPIIEDWVFNCDEDETVVLESLNVQKPKQADQPRKVSQNPRNNNISWNTSMPKKLGAGFQFTPKACFVCGSFNYLIKGCDFYDKRMVQKPVLNNVKKGTGQREVRPSGLVPFSTARQSFSRTTAPVSDARKKNDKCCWGTRDNAIKPTAYWAWRPKIKMINHVYKNTGSCISLAIPGQTTTTKESSNPFMAGSLPKTISPMIHLSQKKQKILKSARLQEQMEVQAFMEIIQALLRRLDRQDLSQLYSLVQERFKDHPLEGHDLDLWGDLRMIFDPNEEDDIWLNQQYWELLRWKLHEYSGVHSLFLDGTSIQINMLVEKKYPLKKEILEKMINLKIEAEEESTMAHELIKFIKSQIAEQNLKVNHKFRGGLLGIKELLQDNAAEGLNTASSNNPKDDDLKSRRLIDVHFNTASTNNSTACLSDATVYAYLATQPNGSQVVHEDLEQVPRDGHDEWI